MFGWKEALLGALGARAIELLYEGVDAIPVTGDPRSDLVEAALMFRRFALDHPGPVRSGVPSRRPRGPAAVPGDGRRCAGGIAAAIPAACRGGPARQASVPEAVLAFHGLCEGMAVVELRGVPFEVDHERLWRDAFRALLAGFAA